MPPLYSAQPPHALPLDCQTQANIHPFLWKQASSVPGMGGSDGVSVLVLSSSTNDVKEQGRSNAG